MFQKKTTEEVEQNADHLKLLEEKKAEVEKEIGQKVLAWLIPVDEDDNALLFLRRPTVVIKRRALDKMISTEEIGQTGQFLLDSLMIKDKSDIRFQDQNNPDNADLILTACISVMDEIKMYSGVLKKK